MTGFAVPPGISRTPAPRMSEGGMAVPDALHFAMTLAESLRKIHDSGRAHGAVEPANIAVSATGPELLPALAPLAGASPYAAPEVLEGQAPDVRSDVFSFGVVVYEMLTGRRPFETEGAMISGAAPAPTGSPAADRFLSQCLARKPAERLQRMQKVLMELKLLTVAARRAEARPVPQESEEAVAIRAEMRELEARLAARLERHEQSVAESERAAAGVLDSLRRELAEAGAQAAAALEQAARAEQSNSATAERVIARVEQALDGMAQRIGRVEQSLEGLGQRVVAAEQGFEGMRQHSGAFENNMTADFQAFEQALKEQTAAIDSTRTAMAQTDDLVERVVEALELLQSSILDQAEGRMAKVN